MRRMLLVDDERNVLEGLRRMLRGAGQDWEIELATNGATALLACRKQRFEVVVADLSMPGMNGADLLEQVRAEFPGTARIVLSGYADAEVYERAAALACCVLSKPCDARQFQAALRVAGF